MSAEPADRTSAAGTAGTAGTLLTSAADAHHDPTNAPLHEPVARPGEPSAFVETTELLMDATAGHGRRQACSTDMAPTNAPPDLAAATLLVAAQATWETTARVSDSPT